MVGRPHFYMLTLLILITQMDIVYSGSLLLKQIFKGFYQYKFSFLFINCVFCESDFLVFLVPTNCPRRNNYFGREKDWQRGVLLAMKFIQRVEN